MSARVKVERSGPGGGRFVREITFGHPKLERTKSALTGADVGHGHNGKGGHSREGADRAGNEITLGLERTLDIATGKTQPICLKFGRFFAMIRYGQIKRL